MKILIKHGRVWDGERFFYADVMTDEGRIAKIEPNIPSSEISESDRLFDARGLVVSAGLVDCHLHLRGISDPIYGCSHDLITMPFGVTAAVDGSGIYGDKSLLQHNILKATTFAAVDVVDGAPDFDSLEDRKRRFEGFVSGYKVYFDNGGGTFPSVEPLVKIMERAEKDGVIVMVHCNGSPVPMSEYLPVFRKGDILTHAFHGGKFTAAEDGFAAIKEAQARGVIIDGGFAGNVHLGFDVLRSAIKNGVIPDVIGSDVVKRSGYVRGGRYGLTECMSIALALGMKEEDIFRAVTSSAANCVGKGGDWGYLKVGRCADIAVLDYTAQPYDCTDKDGVRLAYKNGYRCKLTVADGEVVFVD